MPTITMKDGTRIYHWGSGQLSEMDHMLEFSKETSRKAA